MKKRDRQTIDKEIDEIDTERQMDKDGLCT